MAARNVGNKTIDLTQGTRNISIQGTNTFVQKYIKGQQSITLSKQGVCVCVCATRLQEPPAAWRFHASIPSRLTAHACCAAHAAQRRR
jgi:predicted HicB family RNase H-like nuclease